MLISRYVREKIQPFRRMTSNRLILRVAVAFLLIRLSDPVMFNTTSKLRKPQGYPLHVHQMFKDKILSKPKVSGVWSTWSTWSPCSRSCGGGITQQTRHCISKPTEIKEMLYKKQKRRRRQDKAINHCVGLYKRVRLCNAEDCPAGSNFRREQCAAFNNSPFKGKQYVWEPYLQANDECALNCLAISGGFYATLNKTIADGTSCNRPTTITGKPAPIGTRGICVGGYCKSVGSNGVVGAVDEAPEECDACIKGNCRSISGLYTRPDLPPGYSLVAQIPQGACRILIQQLKLTRNILALKNSNGSYILNGDWQFGNSRLISGAGTQFTYRKQDASSLETITASGPLENAIDIMVFYQQPNPGIKYGYSLAIENRVEANDLPTGKQPTSDIGTIEPRRLDTNPNSVSQRDEAKPAIHPHRRQRMKRKFAWKVVGVSACSKSCGGGLQQTVLTCVREHTQISVTERRCAHIEKPVSHPIRCNVQECPMHWGGHWGPCTGSCGQGVQQYLVQCIEETATGKTIIQSDSLCTPPKPTAASRFCSLPPCDSVSDNELHQNPDVKSYGDWTTGQWSACSVSCGTGTRTRPVTCSSGNCHPESRPPHAEYCENGSCAKSSQISFWLLSEWSQCSEHCGTGVQSRYAVCTRSVCEDTKPEISRACSSDKECGGQWFTGPWGVCSDSCNGSAAQRRDVFCVVKLRGQARITVDMTCPAATKPTEQRTCEGTCNAVWFTGEWSQCEGCPSGVQRREVKCLSVAGKASDTCNNGEMPLVKRSCACSKTNSDNPRDKTRPAQDEPVADRNCMDRIRNCYLAVQARLCQYSYYTTHCCVSCKRAQLQDALE